MLVGRESLVQSALPHCDKADRITQGIRFIKTLLKQFQSLYLDRDYKTV